MELLFFLGALAAIVTTTGVVIGVRRRRSSDYDERLQPRDEPGRAHNDGQAAAAVGLASRSGGGRFGSF